MQNSFSSLSATVSDHSHKIDRLLRQEGLVLPSGAGVLRLWDSATVERRSLRTQPILR